MSTPEQDHDHDHLLKILQAQGHRFMSSFSLYEPSPKKRKRTDGEGKRKKKVSKSSNSDGGEKKWVGTNLSDNPRDIFDNESEGSKNFKEDDVLMTSPKNASAPTVVVFSESHRKSTAATKELKRTFLSSRVSKIKEDEDALSSARGHNPNDQSEEDCTNMQNDALLHRLIHTKLLSGSLNSELELSPAERKKALAGRVLELSGKSKLGKGERAVREAERNKAAKRVREGLLDKKKERERKQLEEAKNLGNYHPTLKKLYEQSSSSSGSNKKKRERGLRMGVGRFSGGILKLSREEINTAQSGNGSLGRRGRGRGRSR